MVDNVLLNGAAKGQSDAGKAAAPAQQVAAAIPPVVAPRNTAPQNDSPTRRSRPSRATMAAGPWCFRSPIRRSAFPGGSAMPAISGRPASSTLSIRARASACRTPRSSLTRRAGRDHRGPLCRHRWRYAGTVPDQVRSGGRAVPRPAQDSGHDGVELAGVPRIQRAAGLLHASVSYRCAIREVRSASTARCRTRCCRCRPATRGIRRFRRARSPI